MTLKEYLAAEDISMVAFCASLGAKKQTVWNYVHGRRFPPAGMQDRIREATGGKVGPDDFVAQHIDRTAA